MVPEIDRLYYTIGIETEGLARDINTVEHQFRKLAGTVASIAATIGMGLGFRQIINDSMKLTIEFDRAMRQVWSITNLTEEQFKQLNSQVIELSKNSVYSASQIANAMYQAISGGVELGNALQFMQIALKAAEAGASDLFTTVDGLTTIMNAWGLSMQQLSQVSDALFVTIREGKITMTELASSIGSVASTASQAGVPLNDILAAVATLTKNGLEASRAFTALNQMIANVIAPSAEAQKKAQQLGIEFNITALASKGLAQFLQDIYNAAEGNQETLSRLFGSVEALRAVFGLTGQNMKEFNDILTEIGSSTGETDKAAKKMADSLDAALKRLQNVFDALKLQLGQALMPFLRTIADIGKRFATWIENMSPAEKTIMGISMALLALIPVVKTVTTLIALMNAVSGNWLSVLAGIGTVLGTLTAVFGMLRVSLNTTNESIQELDQTFTNLSTESVPDFNAKLTQALKNVQNIKIEAEKLIEASNKLIQLATDYNYAQETGLGKTEEIRKEIEELLKTYPALNGAVELTGDKYQIQVDKLKQIIDLELRRIDLAIQQARIELDVIKSQSQFIESQKEMYQRLLDNAKQTLTTNEQLIAKYKQLADQTTDETKKTYYLNMVETFTKAYSTAQESVTKYSQKLSEVYEIQQKQLELEQRLTQLQQTREKLTTAKETAGTQQVTPKIQQQIQELDRLIAEQTKKLDEYTDKTSQAYETDYAVLKQYIMQKQRLLSESATYLAENLAVPEKLKPVFEQISQLEKTLEKYKPEKQIQIIDISEIEKSITALQVLIEQKNKDVAEQLYRTLTTQITSALVRAYVAGNAELISRLEEYQAKLREMGELEIFQPEKKGTNVRETLAQSSEDIKQLYSALERAIAEGNTDLAKKLYGDLLSKIEEGLKNSFVTGNDEFIALFKEWYDQVQKEFGKYFEKTLDLQRLDKQIDLLKEALYAGYSDIARSIYSELSNMLNTGILKAFEEGNEEALSQAVERLRRLETIMSRHERFQMALTETTQETKKTMDAVDDSMARQERRWKDYQKNVEIAILKEQIAGATLEDKISLYEQLIAKYKDLGLATDEYTNQLERLKQIQEQIKQYEQDQLKQAQLRAQALQVERDLQLQVARSAVEKRYEGYNEMYRINQLRAIAKDETQSLDNRINALQEILTLQKSIGESEEIIAETEAQLTQLKELQSKLDEEQKRQIEELAKAEQARLEQQRAVLETQASFYNRIISSLASGLNKFGEVGTMLATVLESVSFTIKEIEQDGKMIGYELVNPFNNLDSLIQNIQKNLTTWSIDTIAASIQSIFTTLQSMFTALDKTVSQTTTKLYQMMKDYDEFEENLQRKQMLQAEQLGAKIGTTATGALLGFFLGGPIGALIGAGIGGMIGNGIAQSLDTEIAQLDKKLGVTWQKIKQELGTDVDSIADALQKALGANTYEEFITNFADSLEQMTKEALIKAFLASEYMQPLFKSLSETISKAVVDGVLTSKEKEMIQRESEKLTARAKPFFEALQSMFSEGTEWAQSTAIKNSITEDTANRLAALLTTINLNVMQIKDKVVDGTIKVEVIKIPKGDYKEYYAAIGG